MIKIEEKLGEFETTLKLTCKRDNMQLKQLTLLGARFKWPARRQREQEARELQQETRAERERAGEHQLTERRADLEGTALRAQSKQELLHASDSKQTSNNKH